MPERSNIQKLSIVTNQCEVSLGENNLKKEKDTMAKKKEKKDQPKKKGKNVQAKKKAKKKEKKGKKK